MVKLGDVLSVDRNQREANHGTYVGLEDIESDSGRFLGDAAPRSVKSSTFTFTDEHVLYGRLRPYLNKVLCPDFDGHCSTEIIPLLPGDTLDRRYLSYWLRSPRFVEAANRTATGARMPRANLNQLLELEVPLPPLDEQRRIVAKLDAFSQEVKHLQSRFNDAVESDQQLRIRALEDAFDQGSRQGWTEMKLGEACRLINGRAYKKAEFLEAGPYPVLRVGNFFTNRNWVFSDLELDADKYCDKGDLLYAWSASFGPRIWDGPKAIFHYHIWKVVPDPLKVRKDYLFRLLQWDVERIRRDHGTGSTMIHVTKGSMEARPVRIPPIAVQDEICSGLDALDAHLSELGKARKAKSEALDALVPSMLGELVGAR